MLDAEEQGAEEQKTVVRGLHEVEERVCLEWETSSGEKTEGYGRSGGGGVEDEKDERSDYGEASWRGVGEFEGDGGGDV